jgi:hypothetical protein
VQDGPFGANEYVAGDGSRIVVLGWWGPHQLGARPHRLRLAGLEPGARYRDLDTSQEHLGTALMQEGMEVPGGTGGDFGSALIRLVRVASLVLIAASQQPVVPGAGTIQRNAVGVQQQALPAGSEASSGRRMPYRPDVGRS